MSDWVIVVTIIAVGLSSYLPIIIVIINFLDS